MHNDTESAAAERAWLATYEKYEQSRTARDNARRGRPKKRGQSWAGQAAYDNAVARRREALTDIAKAFLVYEATLPPAAPCKRVPLTPSNG